MARGWRRRGRAREGCDKLWSLFPPPRGLSNRKAPNKGIPAEDFLEDPSRGNFIIPGTKWDFTRPLCQGGRTCWRYALLQVSNGVFVPRICAGEERGTRVFPKNRAARSRAESNKLPIVRFHGSLVIRRVTLDIRVSHQALLLIIEPSRQIVSCELDSVIPVLVDDQVVYIERKRMVDL